MSDNEELVFNIRLNEDDWNSNVQAWNCPAFDLPSSYVKEAFGPGGTKLAPGMFNVEKGPARVRWQGGKHPSQIIVVVALKEKLSPTSYEKFWQRFAIIVPIITAIIAASATYAGKPSCDTKAFSDAAASIAVAANELGAFTARASGNVCSGGAAGIPPTDAGGLARQGSAIQAKLNGIATALTNAQKK